MFAVKTGVDLIRIERIKKAVERLGQPFLDRIWTKEEQSLCRLSDSPTLSGFASLAARFAAKEAVAKALGTGIGPAGVKWTDIAIVKHSGGEPRILLFGGAAGRYRQLGGSSIDVALSHDGKYALANCVLLLKQLADNEQTNEDQPD